MPEVRLMSPDEREILRSWRKMYPTNVVGDFIFQWYRYRNWENHPPAVAVDDTGRLAGFHGYIITNTGYLNSMFQFVRPEYRGQGIAGAMVEFILAEGLSKGVTRMRMRCPIGKDGDIFWQGFGLKPFGRTDDEHFYDFPLTGVSCLKDLITHANELCADRTFKQFYHTLYFRKYGITQL